MEIDFAPEGEEVEGEDYYPEPMLVYEDSCLIFDPAEFCELYNCHGAQLRGGSLFVLDRTTHKWVNVEDYGKANPPKLSRVQ